MRGVMNINQLDTKPLDNIALVVRLRVALAFIAGTVWRVILALIIIAPFAFLALAMIDNLRVSDGHQALLPDNISFSQSFSVEFGPGIVGSLVAFILWRFWWLVPANLSWSQFAKNNNLSLKSPKTNLLRAFSRKCLTGISSWVSGEIEGVQVYMTLRFYRQGGVLRRRKIHGDTVLGLKMPIEAPWIVIDSHAREATKISNITGDLPSTDSFQFEGVHGKDWTVYTARENRVQALAMFSPEKLEVLYEQLGGVDIEMDGDMMWLVWRGVVVDSKTSKDFISGALALHKSLFWRYRS